MLAQLLATLRILGAWHFVIALPTGPTLLPDSGQCPLISAEADASPLVALNLVPTPYKGLRYQGFGYGRPGVPDAALPLPNAVPHSPFNLAFTQAQLQTMYGTPMLTVNYPASDTRSFDLASFYYSCTLAAGANLADPPTRCLVSVVGYRTAASDNQVSAATQVCAQQFEYLPSTMTGPQQMAFSGPLRACFHDLQFTVVQYSLAGGMAVAASDAVLLLDNVRYAYRKTLC